MVNRDLLMADLMEMELPPEVITVIAKIMQSTSCDIGNGITTHRGVQQGSVLSPTLFAIYINSLIKEIKDTTVGRFAFADDLSFVCENKLQLVKTI